MFQTKVNTCPYQSVKRMTTGRVFRCIFMTPISLSTVNRARLLTSEVQGLSVTIGSLERQLLDREAVCEGLRKEVAAGGDRSQRERELIRQVCVIYCLLVMTES